MLYTLNLSDSFFEDETHNKKVLNPDFLSIQRRHIDESGFPSRFSSAIIHDGKKLVFTFKRDDTYETKTDNTLIVENGVLTKAEVQEVKLIAD